MHETSRDFIKTHFELNAEGVAVWSKSYLKFKVGDLVKFYRDTDYKCEMLYMCLGNSTAIRELTKDEVIKYLHSDSFRKYKVNKCVN